MSSGALRSPAMSRAQGLIGWVVTGDRQPRPSHHALLDDQPYSIGGRLPAAHRRAARRRAADRALVLPGGQVFSNGINLNVIEASARPAEEAWRNINAIDDVCQIITCTGRLVVAAVGGNAGAGGVMRALGADTVLLRDGAVLNPHSRTMASAGCWHRC